MLRRSLLPTPGNVKSKLDKARSFAVDVLMLDLEDGVPHTNSAKALARANLKEALAPSRFAAREVSIRVNSPRTRWFLDDIALIATLDIPTIVVPMIHDADDMVFVERTLKHFNVPDSLGIILLIETPAAVLNLPEMVKASPRTNGLIAGGLDYASEMHSLSIMPFGGSRLAVRHDEDLMYMRQRILAVARAYGLSALDAMRPGLISDVDAFRKDAEHARWLGFDGVDFYHPAYIDVANEVFSPSAEELSWASRILASNTEVKDDAPSSAKVDGRVVLPQHTEIARRLQAMAAEIARK